MASALQTAVLGMRAYQEMLNVTGNNIANADTVAYKEDRITFSDMFSRTLSQGVQASEDIGGTNPVQVGLGVRVANVSKNMTQGSFTSTEGDFDLAMDGDGFFVVDDGVSNVFTRAGTFDVDADGYLVDPATGYRVQRIGTTGEDSGFQISGNNDILIPYNTQLPGSYTQVIDFQGNLSADSLDPTTTKLAGSSMVYSLVGGGLANETSEFADINELQSFAAGDTITIGGRMRDGTAVNTTFTYGAANDGTTLRDLLDSIESAFGGPTACTAAISDGKVTLQDEQSGYSLMDLNLSSASHADAVDRDFDYVEVGGASAQATNVAIYDRQASSHSLTGTFVRHSDDSNVWDFVVNSCADAEEVSDRRIVGIAFDENGVYQGISETDGFGHTSADAGFGEWDTSLSVGFPGITSVQDIEAFFGRPGFYDGLTQVGGQSSAGAIRQDGYATGSLQSISIDASGIISGTFSNGETLEIAALKVAVFDNVQGLERVGSNYYAYTPAAGSTVYSSALQGRAGKIRQSVLEDSNVDIAREFTKLITAQLGFQVNSRTVRVTNTMLQQLASTIT